MNRRRLVLGSLPLVAGLLAATASWGAGAGAVTTGTLALLAALVVAVQVRTIAAVRRTDARGLEPRLRELAGTAAVEADRRHALVTRAIRDHTAQATRRTVAEVRRGAEDDVAQLEAMTQLVRLLEPTALVPRTRGWAASPDVLAVLVQQLVDGRPDTVVDLGSGVSTLMLALAARRHGLDCRIVSIDHDAGFAAKTQAVLAQHGVADHVDVRVAPLRTVEVEGAEVQWYDTSAIADLEHIGLVFVDGPPGGSGPQARFPALPVLRGRLTPDATLLVDDTLREDERAMLDRWQALGDVTIENLGLEKGAALVRVAGTAV